MTVGLSGVSELNSYFNNIYEDAVFTVKEETLATRLVRTFTNGRGDQTRSVTTYPSISYSAVNETEDFAAPTQFDKTLLTTLTPGEFMAQVLLTDRRIETDPDNARADAVTELGRGAADKIDSDIFGNFSSLSCGTLGATGSAMTWGYFFAAISRLRAAKVPRPYVCVLHPYHWHAMAKAAAVGQTVTNAPEFQDTIMQQWYVGSAGGVPIFVSANVQTSASTVGYAAVFNRDALAFDLRRDYRLEPERDASKRAWELNASMMYAEGVWRPAFGVQVIANIAAPES